MWLSLSSLPLLLQVWSAGPISSHVPYRPGKPLPSTNLGDHLSECSGSSPSLAARAPNLKPTQPTGEGDMLGASSSSSISTLREVAQLPFPGPKQAAPWPSSIMSEGQQLQQVSNCGWGRAAVAAAVGPKQSSSSGLFATTPAAAGLGDHLSDATATPSDAGSILSFKVPAPGEVISLSRRCTTSSSQEEIASGGPKVGEPGRGRGWSALIALKSRLALPRRTSL